MKGKNHYALVFILLMLLFAGVVNGQTEKTKINENYFGIVLGGTYSSISNYDSDSRLGFLGGLYWEWKFSEKFSTMPSILWAERGTKDLKLSYITIPLVLKYSVTKKFAIATGLGWDELMTVNSEDYVYSDLRHSDWRIPVTLGYNISDKLAIGISYSFGLTDISPDDNEKLRNNWGTISLAYIFMKKVK